MKRKGFTLIELLAVIVILAIIALIIVPLVSNIIDSARKAAFKESVNGIIDSGGSYLQEYILTHNDELNDFPVEFPCDGTKCGNDEFTLTFKGNAPKSGNIVIKKDGVLAEYITDGKYCAYGYKWNLIVEDDCGEVDVTKPTISGTKNGKVVTLTMVDNASGIDSYCVVASDDNSSCNWVVSTNPSSEQYTLTMPGTWYFFAKDKKGNISDSISFDAVFCSYTNGHTWNFSYTGGVQSYKVPENCSGSYKLEVWGAQGGTANANDSNYAVPGGYGGYSVGTIDLLANDQLYIVVGGKGVNGSSASADYNGGYNGGGASYHWKNNNVFSASGGGATHIAKDNNRGVLKNYLNNKNEVLIVAGGGGGSYYYSYLSTRISAQGGHGGGTNGGTGVKRSDNNGTLGAGGTQSAGGAASGSLAAAPSGVFGAGGNSSATTNGGGSGGGGGWYGGAGSTAAAAGGGSGYIGGVSNGNTKLGNASMPTHNGTSTMTGNSGNGYAKITYLGD